MAKKVIKPATKTKPTPETPEKQVEAVKQEPLADKVEEKTVDETIKHTRSVAFFNRSDTVHYEHNKEKHLVRYLGVERYWSLQQTEICLKDRTVTLVIDGTNPGAGRYLEFPKKTQIVIKSKERRPCIGCGR